ncbi:MAG: hypothetical protein M1820_000733 [Bogoriella megaspora]|nr:MAG: hypothetical protein M1820_000733 [Bogoriella megaspora]
MAFSLPSDDLLLEYANTYLLSGMELGPEAFGHVRNDKTIVSKSLLSLATAFFGIKHTRRDIVLKGLRLYGQSLKDLNQALSGCPNHLSHMVLETIRLMAIFECIISERGWLAHILGLQRLFELRGPESISSESQLRFFEQSRHCMIVASLDARIPTILSQPEWKTIPWRNHLSGKTEINHLDELFAECPALYITRDHLLKQDDDDHKVSQLRALKEAATRLLHQLEQWETNWKLANPNAYSEVAAPSTTPIIIDNQSQSAPAWLTVFQYQSRCLAVAAMLFNATLIIVLELICSLPLAKTDPTDAQVTRPSRLREAGFFICRSVDCHLPGVGWDKEGLSFAFALGMAYSAVQATEPAVGDWLKSFVSLFAPCSVNKWTAGLKNYHDKALEDSNKTWPRNEFLALTSIAATH